MKPAPSSAWVPSDEEWLLSKIFRAKVDLNKAPSRFSEGFKLALIGGRAALSNEIVHNTLNATIRAGLAINIFLFVLAMVLLLPIWLLLAIFKPFGLDLFWLFPTVYDLLKFVLVYSPLIGSLLIQYFQSDLLEKTFDACLRQRDPALAARLKQFPRRNVGRKFLHTLSSLLKLMALSGLLNLVSFIPYIGWLAVIGAKFYVIGRKCSNFRLASLYVLLSLHPWLAPKMWMSSRALGRAILQEYTSRVPDDSYELRLLKQNNMLLLGFAAPLNILLATPFVGPLFYPVAQAAAAEVLLHFTQQQKWDALQLQEHHKPE